MRDLLGAVSFLTRVPTGTGARPAEELARFVPWFPVVGAGVGLAVAGVYAGALQLLPPLPAAAVAVVAGVCLTGAFHEDGLGDTADAFAGGWDRDSTLRILQDPRLGTFGVLAVAASLLLRVAAVAALAPAAALAALPAAHALSRAGAVATMAALPVASGTGLGATSTRSLSRRRAWASPWPCSARPPPGRPRPPRSPPTCSAGWPGGASAASPATCSAPSSSSARSWSCWPPSPRSPPEGGDRPSRPCLP